MIRSQSFCFLGIVTIYFFFSLFPLPNTLASPTRSLYCRSDQRDALLEVQKEFHVPTTFWNKSVNCCSWYGVKCDAILGEVISLNLCIFDITVNASLKSTSGIFILQQLRKLDLAYCSLQGEIPSSIGNLSHLTYLDLSHNQLVGEVPASVGNLNQLEYLNLGSNNLKGTIPTSFSNFTNLSELILAGNQLTGGDIVLANLTSLKSIDLSYNHFQSSIFPYLSGLHNLKKFLGQENFFGGPFPSSLLMIPSLSRIDLSQNHFVGPIDFGNTSYSSSRLWTLDVGFNDFDGPIPESISKLPNLQMLYLNHNNFRGRVPRSISKLVNLTDLDLSHNNLGGRVPRSMSKLVNLNRLDLSYNKFGGQIPHVVKNTQRYVDLSHNNFSSFGESVEYGNGSLGELDLSSNSLKGPIPQWICNYRDIYLLDLSNNHFTGSIPQWICNYRLSLLDLSSNHFTGSIPQCLKNSTELSTLNLKNNSLSGFLPDFCINGSQLRSLDINGNNLVGKLPKSLSKCTEMELLNVRGNKIKDTFPFWLGSLQGLKIISLRSNAFYGPVYNPYAYLGFPSLRIIDISNNNFVGSLPQDYFAKWTEMSLVWRPVNISYREKLGGDGTPYAVTRQIVNFGNSASNYMGDLSGRNISSNLRGDSIDLVFRGVDMDFDRIFKGFKAIDFSGNRFSGQIPASIGLMIDIRFLNLSGNTFTGNIPASLANITKLEILDLSQNNLSGEIPQGLGKLSFLSYINFSHNHLQGLVPQSTQFGTQNCSSFVGNPGLYGLEKICGKPHVPVPTAQEPEESLSEPEEPVLNWIAAAITFGPGVFCGVVIGHIFTSYKKEWFMAR